mmetsp:Transcript_24324/g.79366  ORF Transcript_24324/g.79366 Transcript_24324/m.79366 type:complete len:270 (-) Transcript_24324:71-880(-)
MPHPSAALAVQLGRCAAAALVSRSARSLLFPSPALARPLQLHSTRTPWPRLRAAAMRISGVGATDNCHHRPHNLSSPFRRASVSDATHAIHELLVRSEDGGIDDEGSGEAGADAADEDCGAFVAKALLEALGPAVAVLAVDVRLEAVLDDVEGVDAAPADDARDAARRERGEPRAEALLEPPEPPARRLIRHKVRAVRGRVAHERDPKAAEQPAHPLRAAHAVRQPERALALAPALYLQPHLEQLHRRDHRRLRSPAHAPRPENRRQRR